MSKPRYVPSRSERAASDYKDLESFFKATDEDVSTFADALKELNKGVSPPDISVTRRLMSGKPDKVVAPRRFQESLSGFVRIFHGWHRKDYVWHVEHASVRRPWKVPIDRVIYMIAKTMHEVLPDVHAVMFPPHFDWELKTVTFKALNLSEEWSFSDDLVEKANNRLFDILNKVV